MVLMAAKTSLVTTCLFLERGILVTEDEFGDCDEDKNPKRELKHLLLSYKERYFSKDSTIAYLVARDCMPNTRAFDLALTQLVYEQLTTTKDRLFTDDDAKQITRSVLEFSFEDYVFSFVEEELPLPAKAQFSHNRKVLHIRLPEQQYDACITLNMNKNMFKVKQRVYGDLCENHLYQQVQNTLGYMQRLSDRNKNGFTPDLNNVMVFIDSKKNYAKERKTVNETLKTLVHNNGFSHPLELHDKLNHHYS